MDYWDSQLIELLRHGFPLDFNRGSNLNHDLKNLSSANSFPHDIEAYLAEELSYGAIVGPFDSNPINQCHHSPFMTREKDGSDCRRVIVDLSWPKGYSVNAGIDKNSYLNSEFALQFPTVDHIVNELKCVGRGAHIFKTDVSHTFHHLKVNPADLDLLGLYWDAHYVDTCLPFGSRHGTQNYQCISDAVRYVMRQRGHRILNYVDDFLGVGTPRDARIAFSSLYSALEQLGLTIRSWLPLVPGQYV